MKIRRERGVTLIELLIVVVLLGIMAAVAIPSYSAYVKRGQRAAGKAALEQAAQLLERNYTSSGCYDFTDAASCNNRAGNAFVLPFNTAPSDGAPATYLVGLDAPPAGPAGQTFSVSATPCGSAACPAGSNTAFADPDCGKLSLDNTGAKNSNGTLSVNDCWQR
jgi:type IV pilus assembly protein PilE